jgi:polyisoprenoid-binding protein YceI
MTLSSGRQEFGPGSGRLLVRTGRTGLGRRAGHDLTIEVTRWSAEALVDAADPASSAVSAEIEVASLEVREGAGGVKPLTDSDRAEIGRTMREEILDAASHPSIAFRSTKVAGSPESFTVEGDLTIMGQDRPVTVHAQIVDGRLRGHAIVVQTSWGIKPYSAFFGALRLADEVRVEFDLGLPG